MSNLLATTLPSEDGDKFEVAYKIENDLKLGGNDDPAVEVCNNNQVGNLHISQRIYCRRRQEV